MIRLNPDPSGDLLSALQTVKQQQDGALLQLATGRRVNTPSDDPTASARVIGNHDLSSQADSFQQSSNSISGLLQTADSTIGSVVTALTRAQTLGIQGANGTLSDANRQSIAVELQGIQGSLVSLANISYQGQFVFSGTQRTQPYTLDPTSPSGVRYNGNGGTNSVAIGNIYNVQTNLPGSQILSAPGNDVFQAIQDLITAVSSNGGISAAVSKTKRRIQFRHCSTGLLWQRAEPDQRPANRAFDHQNPAQRARKHSGRRGLRRCRQYPGRRRDRTQRGANRHRPAACDEFV